MLTGTGQGFDTWTADGGLAVLVEEGAPAGWTDALDHTRPPRPEPRPAFEHAFGHANLIVRSSRRRAAGAADPRARVGAAAGF